MRWGGAETILFVFVFDFDFVFVIVLFDVICFVFVSPLLSLPGSQNARAGLQLHRLKRAAISACLWACNSKLGSLTATTRFRQRRVSAKRSESYTFHHIPSTQHASSELIYEKRAEGSAAQERGNQVKGDIQGDNEGYQGNPKGDTKVAPPGWMNACSGGGRQATGACIYPSWGALASIPLVSPRNPLVSAGIPLYPLVSPQYLPGIPLVFPR